MKLKSIIILASIFLSSCSSDMLIANSGAGGLTVYDKRNLTTVMDDQNIKQEFEHQIATLEAFDSSHIVISSFDHTVLLVGQTPQATLRVNAEKIAQRIKGVKTVYNEIQIQNETSNLTRTNDAWITTKVKAQMLTHTGLRSAQIKVITENSMVYLMGKVTPQQARLAVFATQHVKGVSKVIRVFEIERTSANAPSASPADSNIQTQANETTITPIAPALITTPTTNATNTTNTTML